MLGRSQANDEMRGQGDDHAARERDDWSGGAADAHIFVVLRLARWKLGETPLVSRLVEGGPDVADEVDGAVIGHRKGGKYRHRRHDPGRNWQDATTPAGHSHGTDDGRFASPGQGAV